MMGMVTFWGRGALPLFKVHYGLASNTIVLREEEELFAVASHELCCPRCGNRGRILPHLRFLAHDTGEQRRR